MRVKHNFTFRQLKHRESGEFTPEESEKSIQYKEAYILLCDDVAESGDIYEMEFKIDVTQTDIIEKLKNFKYMDTITLELDICAKRDKKTAFIKLIDVAIENQENDKKTQTL